MPRVITTDEQRGPRAKGPKAKKLNPNTKPDRERERAREVAREGARGRWRRMQSKKAENEQRAGAIHNLTN